MHAYDLISSYASRKDGHSSIVNFYFIVHSTQFMISHETNSPKQPVLNFIILHKLRQDEHKSHASGSIRGP